MDSNYTEFEQYLRYERQVSMHTLEAYLKDVAQYYSWTSHAPAFTQAEVTEYGYYLKSLGYRYSTLHRKLAALRAFFDFLFREEVISCSPKAWFIFPKRERRLPRVVSRDRIGDAAERISGRYPLRDLAILDVLYGCGLRVSECCGLEIQHVYLMEGWIDVVGKGGKQRRLPILNTTKLAIEAYLMHERPLMVSGRSKPSSLFLNRFGKALSRQAIFKWTRKLFYDQAIPVSPHQLRHSYASRLVGNGLDVRYVQLLLGHASVATTQIYTHLSMDRLKQVYRQAHPRVM